MNIKTSQINAIRDAIVEGVIQASKQGVRCRFPKGFEVVQGEESLYVPIIPTNEEEYRRMPLT